MDDKAKITGFLVISELYLKMTEDTDKVITEEEINLLISNINNSNLSILLHN